MWPVDWNSSQKKFAIEQLACFSYGDTLLGTDCRGPSQPESTERRPPQCSYQGFFKYPLVSFHPFCSTISSFKKTLRISGDIQTKKVWNSILEHFVSLFWNPMDDVSIALGHIFKSATQWNSQKLLCYLLNQHQSLPLIHSLAHLLRYLFRFQNYDKMQLLANRCVRLQPRELVQFENSRLPNIISVNLENVFWGNQCDMSRARYSIRNKLSQPDCRSNSALLTDRIRLRKIICGMKWLQTLTSFWI